MSRQFSTGLSLVQDPEGVALLVTSLEGEYRARLLFLASFCAFVYDTLLTFDEELEYFWAGPWTLSRALFFLNRYVPVIAMVLGGVAFFASGLSQYTCSFLIHGTFITVIIGVSIVQAIIVLRICYVYSKNLAMRTFLVACFVVTATATIIVFSLSVWKVIDPIDLDAPAGLAMGGCKAPPSQTMWRLYVANMIFHTILFIATTVPAIRMRRLGKKSQLMDTLVMDGGIFYAIVFGAACFSTFGAADQDPLVQIPAIFSNLLLALSSIAVSRLMLNIHSLASRVSLSPDWLLSNTELSRVKWRPGRRQGELIVEVEAANMDEGGQELQSVSEESAAGRKPSIVISRVGVLDHPSYPGTRDFKTPKKLPRVAFRNSRQ